jgi:hypothetical protein
MTDRPRIIQVIEFMPERASRGDRISHMSEDVRDTMLRAAAKLADVFATRYSITGWKREDDAEYAVVERKVIARLRITRAD